MNPNNRAIRRHLQCINCNIVVDTLRRFVVLELDTRVISLISYWIAPILITENDYICEACWDIAMHAVNEALALDNSGEQAAGSSHQGHREVCVLCGLSILRRRSDIVFKENAMEHQLTTEQANRSRLVTLCRWVVEVVNGYFKRDFKLLRQDYFNKTVPHMMQHFSIAASLLNRFGVRLRNRDDAGEMINIIRERISLPNNLSRLVENPNMNRRSSNFVSITADRDNLIIFPRMEMNELILFALGTYQLRQARLYYGEHVRFHGGYRIEITSDSIDTSEYNLRGSGNNTLIRGKIKSRHISRKQYYVYILIENDISGREGIAEYCCNCLVGRRTVGCCAHVMTIVWYLGWARYQSNISAPAEYLDSVVVREDIE